MARHGRVYRPTADDRGAPEGHRIHDLMVSLLGEALRPADVLDAGKWYVYDDLVVG